jgi:hypothetical protein
MVSTAVIFMEGTSERDWELSPNLSNTVNIIVDN